MPMPTNTLTGSVPLKLAKKITENVNELWESGEFLELVTPTTKELLSTISQAKSPVSTVFTAKKGSWHWSYSISTILKISMTNMGTIWEILYLKK